MFWDGTRWVDERPARRSSQTSRLRDWFATAAMLVVAVAFAVPFASALARAPQVTVSPNVGPTGQQVEVRGTGLAPHAIVELLWDGAPVGVTGIGTNGGGAFKARLTVPLTASAGGHSIGARIQAAASSSGNAVSATATQTTSATFLVTPAGTDPTAEPPTTAAPSTPGRTAGPTVAPAPTVAPSATPTATPQGPAPTATPPGPAPATPPPPPAPTSPPTPSPTQPPPAGDCTKTLRSGSGDRTNDLLALIGSVPNGSTICFDATTFVVNGQVKISGRSNLEFVGPATLKTTTADRGNKSLFQVNNSTGIVFRDLVLTGGRLDPGTYYPTHEYETAIDYHASSGTVSGMTMRAWGGDAVYMGAFGDGAALSHDITVRDSIIDGTGRMGVALTAAKGALITGNSFDNVALTVIDLEPNSTTHETSNVVVSYNTVRRWGLDPTLRPWFFEADTGRANNLTIKGNTFIGSALTVDIGRWMDVQRSNVTITGNTSNIAGKSPFGSGNALLYLWHIDGLVVRDNTQAIATGSTFADVRDCTSVTMP